MATSLLKYERCETTVPKAKELRRVVEPLVRLGAEDTLHNRRKAYSYLLDKAVVYKLFTDIGPRFKQREGGYTRIVRTRVRHGDAAEMAVIELLSEVKSLVKSAAETQAKTDGEAKKTAKKAKAASESTEGKAKKPKAATAVKKGAKNI